MTSALGFTFVAIASILITVLSISQGWWFGSAVWSVNVIMWSLLALEQRP